MNLRELLIERIMYAIDEDILMEVYEISEQKLLLISDEELLEIYEETVIMEECTRRFTRPVNATVN